MDARSTARLSRLRPHRPALALLLLLAALSADAELRFSAADGAVLEDAERELRVDLDGRFALDWVQYDSRNARDPQARLDRALLGVSASWRDVVEGRVLADLAGIDTRHGLWEAWISARRERRVRLTAGLLRLPLGVEHSLREGARPVVGYPGFPAFLTGRSDLAVQLDGELHEGLFSYDVSAALGEGFDLMGQRRGDPQLAGRLMSYPLRPFDASVDVGPYTFPLLSGWFVSFAYAWTPEYDGHLDVATPLRNVLFDSPRLDGRDSRFWHLGTGVDLGPIRVVHEVVRGTILDVRIPAGGRFDVDDEIHSWQLLVSWRITGEPYDSRPFRQRDRRRPPVPGRPLGGGGIGSLELAFAYANADIDREFQTEGFIPPSPNPSAFPSANFASSQEFRTATAALHWVPVAPLRVSAQVVRVIADQFPAAFDSHGRDTSWLLRVQYTF